MGTAGGAGFGGAFIQGLTSALETGRERKYRDQQRKQQSALSAANFLLGSGQVTDIADLEPILATAMPEVFGEAKGKKGGKGQAAVDHKGMVSQVLSSVLQGNAGGLQVPPPAGAASIANRIRTVVRTTTTSSTILTRSLIPLNSNASHVATTLCRMMRK